MSLSRKLFLTILSVLSCAGLSARTDGSETDKALITAHFGLAGSPVAASFYFTPEVNRGFWDYWPSDDAASLSQVYQDWYGPSRTTGTFIGGVDVALTGFLSLTVDVGLNFMWKDSFYGVSGESSGREKGVALYLLPMCKFSYLKRPVIRLYGSAGAGVCKYFGYSSLLQKSGNGYLDKSFKLEAQLVPIGFELGRKLFFYMELGLGTVYVGANAGVGYRF